jgi:hypothetical protein
MSDTKSTEVSTPPCPMCSKQTFLKQTHREQVPDLVLLVFKCVSCAVEYPVLSPAPG